MKSTENRPARQPLTRTCLVALPCLGLLTAVHAEANPYSLGVGASVLHDSNVLHLSGNQQPPVGQSRADTIYSASLQAGLDQPIGRQRLFGQATLKQFRYADNDMYNGLGYQMNLGLDWATLNRLTGTLAASATRDQRPTLRDAVNGLIAADNAESTRQFDARFALGTVTRLTFEGALGHRSVDYSATASRFRNYTQDSAMAGVRFQSSPALGVALNLRHARLEYPHLLSALADTRDRRQRTELLLLGTWVPSGASSLNTRLAWTRTTHDQISTRDYSTLAGGFDWIWQPGGRLKLETRLSRDAGQDDTLTTTALSRTTDTLGVRAAYSLGGKTTLNLAASTYRRTQLAAAAGSSALHGRDSGHALSLGLSWQALRNLSLSCDLQREQRGANTSPQIQEAYSATAAGCNGQLLLR